MNKIYSYSSLLVLFSFLFTSLKYGNYLLGGGVVALSLIVSSKVYKFQKGKKISNAYQKLPIIKGMAYLLKDDGIKLHQNYSSIQVLLLSASYGFSMLVVFALFRNEISSLLLLIGAFLFSLLFSKLFTIYKLA